MYDSDSTAERKRSFGSIANSIVNWTILLGIAILLGGWATGKLPMESTITTTLEGMPLDGLKITLDGKDVGVSPLHLRIPPGMHRIRVTGPGDVGLKEREIGAELWSISPLGHEVAVDFTIAEDE
jgi:hypothetical protein